MIKTENGQTSGRGDLNELLNDLAGVVGMVKASMESANVPEDKAAEYMAKAIAVGLFDCGHVEEATIVEVPEWMK